jgi:hypothetical protein
VDNLLLFNTIFKIFFIVHPYTHSLHISRITLPLIYIQVHNSSGRNGSGKLLNNRFINKTLTNGGLFTAGQNRLRISYSTLIPFTKNQVGLGCFSTKKTIYTRCPVRERSTDSWLFHGIFKVFFGAPNL